MAKLKLRVDSRKAGSILIAFIMLFSALGYVGDFFSKQEQSVNGEKIGTLGGNDVFKKADQDYFIADTQNNLELHFRSNPLVAKDVQITREADWMISYLRQGPSGYLIVFFNTSRIGVLMDPDEETRVITAATEITQALGYRGWDPSIIEPAFIHESGRPDIKVVSEKLAQQSNDTMYFYIYTNPSENNTVIKYMGKIIYIQAPDYDSLDLAADRIKLGMFGYI